MFGNGMKEHALERWPSGKCVCVFSERWHVSGACWRVQNAYVAITCTETKKSKK